MTLPFTGEEYLESLRDGREVWISALAGGDAKRFTGLAEQCMAEYDLDGWTIPGFIDPDDVSLWGKR